MRQVSVLLVTCLLLAADTAKDDPGKQDQEALQGDWACDSMVRDGMKLPDDDAQALFRTVKGDEYTVFHFSKPIGKGKVTLDASKKPKAMDISPANAPKDAKPIQGIYELDGDTLRMCYAPPGKDRPTAFESKEGSGWTLTVWKREKK